ncbi:helix-turn-helix domain-containing protein [Amylibacter sp. SFDW26]|uniref:GlxA family transcriptional regulator n=1 Tax=Amylibacter sp. SFDW26 TaxID=2652722 RepID=UPI0012625A57|nr:DJ-1/PfpI family protein [Amylibacter sp. SFDW26]KAB7613423.1 helix-turn-helix domain-containing protein [Amylibacter sp. SFDW26]
MDKPHRHIDILLFDNVSILDIAGPAQAYEAANEGQNAFYKTRFVSMDGRPVKSSCGLTLCPDAVASTNSFANDLIIPGGKGTDHMLKNTNLKALITDWQKTSQNRRLISICSGALLLANTGLLDGQKATTHWSREAQATNLFPKVNWLLNQLYTIEDTIMTSAGITSGIDLTLAIIRKDCGPQVALSVARELVVYLQRSGGQSQFANILQAQFNTEGMLSKLVEQIIQQPNHPWDLAMMADHINMTPRTLSRRFKSELGASPVNFLEQVRVKQACDVLNAGMSVGKTIEHCGFGDFQRMQRAFKRHLMTTVGAYQKRFAPTENL